MGGPGPGSGCTSIHPAQAQLALDMLASVSRNSLPRPASRHSRSIRFQTQEGIATSVLAVASAIPRTCSLHSQFGPRRMGRHCGNKKGCLLTAGPVANMNLTRLNSNPGLHQQPHQLAFHFQGWPEGPRAGRTARCPPPTITAAAGRGAAEHWWIAPVASRPIQPRV